MAKLLPPYIDKNCKSTGEKMIFDIFKNNSFTKDWIILHSLNLSQHTVRLYGEIDFLILIPNGGIFVMEVKGGDVKCIDGVWHFTDKFKNTYTSNDVLWHFSHMEPVGYTIGNSRYIAIKPTCSYDLKKYINKN